MRKIMVIGSIFAVVIILFASFPSVVGYKTKDLPEVNVLKDKIQNLKERILGGDWYPGYYLLLILTEIVWIILCWLFMKG